MTICNKITLFLIKREIISNSDIDIFNYGIFVILYNMFLIFNILIIGLFFYKFSFALQFLLFWTPYRIFIGGSHCSTPLRCWIFFDLYFIFAIFLSAVLDINILIVANTLMLFFHLFSTKFKITYPFIIFWVIFYIFLCILPHEYILIMNITYLLNSFLTIHKIYINKFII
ncbi:accessory gene regulator B family protein [Faecalibacillus faecis]|uniref:Accessory gene regulator B family protein n=1 Tax=Faecalibacillus faecis TaxID=1982628 RepID=A0AAW4VVW5_9FIRM|nr:accessory gene regulator B family protein [Faecalibacillus faecis]MCB8611068.1 accessory gene regulator B family protein [Faecalibacillus faecis]